MGTVSVNAVMVTVSVNVSTVRARFQPRGIDWPGWVPASILIRSI